MIGMGVAVLLCNSIFIPLCSSFSATNEHLYFMQVLARTGEHLWLLQAIRFETFKGGCAVSMLKHNGIMRLPHNE